ncbi:hypothetical protein EXN66_Car004884 [Channa argus]|uniref:Uncharacterized protein n=1 Tax=Channa argus TaxID=215402 RepID=A0A6G1PG45_CHAAH|nr:hypothetical protein EXN66_Car004884 [Channa argus]
MVARVHLLSILVCFLIELDCCSGFPRVRSSYSEALPSVRDEQDAYGFGNSHFVHSSTQSNPKLLTPNDQVKSEPSTWEPSWTRSSQAQMQYQPGLDHQTRSLNQPWSAGSFQPQSQVPMPKAFQFNFQVPMVEDQSRGKENGSSTKGSSSNKGESHHASYNPRPSSVHIQSSFNSPSFLHRFLDQNGGKKPHDTFKPSFGLSLSLPISPTTSPSNPTTSSKQILTPERSSFAENSHAEPERVHTDRVITFPTEHATKLSTPTEQFSHSEIPPEHTWVFPGQTQYPALPLQSWQPENVFNGYYHGQINPTTYQYWRDQTVSSSPNNAYYSLDPWQYNVASRPSGISYGQYQICHADGTPLTLAEQYALLIPTYDWHKPVPPQRPGPHSYAPFSHQSQPSFDDGKVSGIVNYQMGHAMPMGQDGFFSPYPHQHSLGQSREAAHRPTGFDSSRYQQGLSTRYEAQVGKQVAGYPAYPGQYKYY